jgi:uncharacterized membrane protein
VETRKRSIIKAVSWQSLGLGVMTLLGYLFTGSFSQGGSLAIVAALVSLIIYVLHERLWAHIPWGREPSLKD